MLVVKFVWCVLMVKFVVCVGGAAKVVVGLFRISCLTP